jgi:hypothetical protein
MSKSTKPEGQVYECNPFSVKHSGKALGSSPDKINPFSLSKSGKPVVVGSNQK